MRLRLAVIASLVAILLPAAAQGQVILGPQGPYSPEAEKREEKKRGKPSRDEPQVFRLTLTPAGEPTPALKYSLMPEYDRQTPGNSVPYYYRALIHLKNQPREQWKPFYDDFDRWISEPLSRFPKEEVEKFLRGFSTVFEQLQIATHREKTEWDWRIRDRTGVDAIMFLLEETQEARSLARLLILKSRVEIVEGRYEDAVRTFQMGYKLARDTGQPPLLINNLVGLAIEAMMSRALLDLIDAHGSPNLYWAISAIPDPLVEMRPALEYEMRLPVKMFPFLKDPESARHSPEEWSEILTQAAHDIRAIDGRTPEYGELDEESKSKWRAIATAMVLAGYPRAKQELIEAGYDRQKLEEMPVGQLVAVHQAHVYRYMAHEMFKWWYVPDVPYRQAQEGLDRAHDKLKEEGYFSPPRGGREIIPIARSLLPAVQGANEAAARRQIQRAGLRTLEAIRMHAAVNDGKLPGLLDEISVVPVAVNPADGKLFPYRLEADKAILDIPFKNVRASWRLEITIEPGGS